MIPTMAELVGSRGDRHIWMTRGHLAALGLMTICIAVLSFMVGLKVGRSEAPSSEPVATTTYLPDPADGDALETLLHEVERVRSDGADTPTELGFPDELSGTEPTPPPAERAPPSDSTVVAPAAGAAPEAPPPPEAEGAQVPEDGWAVQIAALESATEADQLVTRLLDNGHEAYRTEALVRGTTWYRVRVGGFDSKEDAAEGQGVLSRELGRTDLLVARAP